MKYPDTISFFSCAQLPFYSSIKTWLGPVPVTIGQQTGVEAKWPARQWSGSHFRCITPSQPVTT